MTIQVPPAVGSSGQFLDSLILTSSTHRQIIMVGDPVTSSAFAPVSSSGGLLISVSNPSTAVTVTNPTTAVSLSSAPTVNVSSGTFTLSSAPTVNVSSGTFTLSSSPLVLVATSGGTIPVSLSTVFSLSSTPLVGLTGTSSAQAVVTTSGGLLIQVSNPTTAVTISNSSFTVNLSTVFSLSSAPLVIVATSGGTPLVQVTSGSLLVLTSPGITQVLTSGTLVVQTSGAVTLSSAGITQVLVVTSSGVNLYSTRGQIVTESTEAAGGVTSTYKVLTSIGSVKASAGRLLGFSAYTTEFLGAWIQFYDATTGNVTVGTSMKMSLPIGGWSTLAGGSTGITGAAGLFAIASPQPIWFGPNGINFATAISANVGVSASGATVSTAAGAAVSGVACTFFYV